MTTAPPTKPKTNSSIHPGFMAAATRCSLHAAPRHAKTVPSTPHAERICFCVCVEPCSLSMLWHHPLWQVRTQRSAMTGFTSAVFLSVLICPLTAVCSLSWCLMNSSVISVQYWALSSSLALDLNDTSIRFILHFIHSWLVGGREGGRERERAVGMEACKQIVENNKGNLNYTCLLGAQKLNTPAKIH